MYEIHIESEEFREKRTVQQHQMVNEVRGVRRGLRCVRVCVRGAGSSACARRFMPALRVQLSQASALPAELHSPAPPAQRFGPARWPRVRARRRLHTRPACETEALRRRCRAAKLRRQRARLRVLRRQGEH